MENLRAKKYSDRVLRFWCPKTLQTDDGNYIIFGFLKIKTETEIYLFEIDKMDVDESRYQDYMRLAQFGKTSDVDIQVLFL